MSAVSLLGSRDNKERRETCKKPRRVLKIVPLQRGYYSVVGLPQALQDRIPGRADVTEQIKEAIRWLCALGFLPDCSQHHVFRSIAVKHFQLL